MKLLSERVNKLTLDPAVANVLHDMDAAREARKMQKRERDAARRKQSRDEARKKREAERQAARERITVDVPTVLSAQLAALAASHSVPVSGLVTLAIARLLSDVGSGQVDLMHYKHPSRSPRYEWVIEIGTNLH